MIRILRALASYVLLFGIGLIMVGPLLWLFSTALKSTQENIFVYPPQLLPRAPTLAHFVRVWRDNPFGRYLFNSLVVAGLSVVGNLLGCSLAAYPLARLTFPGKSIGFWLLVSTTMIPFQITMIPLYVWAVQLNLRNSYLGLVFPYLISGFGIFLLRQAMLGIPRELEEAARLDGCSLWGIWWHVMIPAVRPDLTTLAVFTFVGTWGDFLWPLLVTDDPELYTLPLGISNLASVFSADWRLVAAGSVLAILPVLLLFGLAQRYVIPSETGSGLQG